MKHLIFSIIILFSSIALHAQDFPEPMKPKRIVNDFAKVFKEKEATALENKLKAFNDTTSTQIAIITVTSLNGYSSDDYAQRIGEKWGVGQKGKDNGIVILIKPKTYRERGDIAISVGYGLEGVIPDAIASRIIRSEIIPEFQNNKYYAGINKATDIIMKLSSGEFTAEQYAKKSEMPPEMAIGAILLFLFIIIAVGISAKKNGFTTDSRGSTAAPFIFFGTGGSRHGRGSRGFGSGGGFRGFGGGGFGGGGASGSW